MNPFYRLCNKDPRNPLFHDLYDYEDEKPIPREGCACDNCFYGRDVLALEIIRLNEAILDSERRYEQAAEGLVEGSTRPHNSPSECPTYYDGCNCSVDCLVFNIDRAEKAEARVVALVETLEGVYNTPKGYQDVCWNLAADALGKPRPK